jgi:hypothetical protein
VINSGGSIHELEGNSVFNDDDTWSSNLLQNKTTVLIPNSEIRHHKKPYGERKRESER